MYVKTFVVTARIEVESEDPICPDDVKQVRDLSIAFGRGTPSKVSLKEVVEARNAEDVDDEKGELIDRWTTPGSNK